MKKPKKTLKDLGRLEKLLAKQTARTAKLLSHRKSGDDENPALTPFYDRIADRHAAALADLSEITRQTEALGLQMVEADAAKAARKAYAKSAPEKKRVRDAKVDKPAPASAPKRASRPPAKIASA
jgi:hypothetical protein